MQDQKNAPQQAAGQGGQVEQTRKQLSEKEAQVSKLKEEAQRAQGEMERLLQLMQMSQEEQFAKDKTIMELQEALKNERTKRAQAAAEDQRRANEGQANRSQVTLRSSQPVRALIKFI